MKEIAYLSLGANLGDRAANLREALSSLKRLGAIIKISNVYETEPVDVEASQPWFLNCACALETELSPERLLAATMALEQAMGRRREESKGARTIDIDILLVGSAVLRVSGLIIPHPEMHRRRFVLEPLAEIAPDIRHPVLKRTVAELLARLPPGAEVRQFHER